MDFEHMQEYLDHNIGFKKDLKQLDKEKVRSIVKQIKLHARQLEHENKHHNPVKALNNLFKEDC